MIKYILLFLLFSTTCLACEFGVTRINTYGKPDSYDLAVASDSGAYYFPERGRIVWIQVFFKDGVIEIPTGYTWCNNENPPPKGKEPYVMYKSKRWYPNYHGIIYVYQDGKERK